ncbi:MAG: hypothetical protein KKB91_02855 [Proteobacteria bacterium]|jgi:hypothetical protein|nr:hypothetical protein [Desulfocapsa sp.]MBU3945879.1 hypothetical protein [Pseudomonadota bacterium]MCG2745596.1 hypothetical protein [Desulfobacteraceae bacterium]MDO8948524.1 hypothetical protein [Desulfocapsaceae bacterium]MBU3982833.1 hypothetical protein [Pseudomonadota bacterium]
MKNFPSIDKIHASSTTATNVSTEISKIAITALSITACIMGCWAVASMIAGAVNSGGPIGLVVNLFTAING